jgi:hypothetical protein
MGLLEDTTAFPGVESENMQSAVSNQEQELFSMIIPKLTGKPVNN